jgi:hypothetical protein
VCSLAALDNVSFPTVGIVKKYHEVAQLNLLGINAASPKMDEDGET